MEFLLADILIPTFDFIWNGIEWVLGILFGTGVSGEFNLAQGNRYSIKQNVSLEKNKYSPGGSTTRTSVEPEPPTTGPSADETFLEKASNKFTPGAKQIVRDSSPLRFPLNLEALILVMGAKPFGQSNFLHLKWILSLKLILNS